MTSIIIGIVILIIGGVLIVLRRKQQDKLLEIKSTQTSTAKDLTELCQSVKDELGTTGGFKQQAEVKGVIRCDRPITGELSKQACVYYDMKVEERYEETYYENDAQGRQQRRTRTGSTVVASNSQRIPFYVDDGTGRVLINPNSADIDPVQVLSQYEARASGTITVGGFSFTASSGRGDRRILGYQFAERILPLERNVYILGEASDSSGQLTIQVPGEKGKPFLITLKSEEELARSTESAIKGLMAGAIICWVIGIGAVAYSVFAK
ncbi:hypothetical protein HUU42_05295 [bacterium]|nr:hypothetical protein [bacterium]